MKRILINATHNEEIRVALCKDNHLYDFDLENRTREQKKANIYKGHITRIEPSLEAVFVEYGSVRQGFLPLREIAPEYLKGNVHEDNIRQLLKEGDEVIVQVEKEERGNKGAALSTYISLAGRYLVLMPNNAKAGGISRQISGKVRDEMKQIIASLSVPRGMSVIVRTAGLGKGYDDLQNDLNHLLDIWASILDQSKNRPSPCLVHQEAGVVTRAVRDYLRDDIGEVWIDSENAYNEAANFIAAVMPTQMNKLRKYTEYEPLFARFGVERQIESAYQREVRLPSGGSIVIDQTEALVSIDINSSKSTKGSDVAETAYHTNLEAADEIARQLRLRDMGGLIVIDFIDMNDPRHQKDVEKRLIDATRYDRARVQFAEISKFGLMEMSRQRLRPSLEESTGYICPRCHGNGMIRDLRSLALSIMRQIEQIALKERTGEIQAEVPTEIAAFLLNEKRESLVYLEQDSGARITILPHAHLESPNFSLHFNPDGFAPSSYERIADAEEKDTIDRGYDTNWHTKTDEPSQGSSRWQKAASSSETQNSKPEKPQQDKQPQVPTQAVAWLSNLFAPKPQARLASSLNNADAAAAIESIVNGGAVSLGAFGSVALPTVSEPQVAKEERQARNDDERKARSKKPTVKREAKDETPKETPKVSKKEEKSEYPKREAGSQRPPRGEVVRQETLKPKTENKTQKTDSKPDSRPEKTDKKDTVKPRPQKSTTAKSDDPKGDNIVLHVSTITPVVVPSETIHLSLDGSKPKKLVADTDSESPKQQSLDVATEHTPQSEPAVAQDTPTNEVSKPPQVSEPSTVQETTTQETVAPVLADVQTDQPQSKVSLPEPAQPATDISTDSAVIALAKATNRATNDPRVVYEATKQPAITLSGSAGAFVKAVLGERATGQFVNDFISALAQNSKPATVFDFANYGYAPLSADYVSGFMTAISPVGQYTAAQGKTAVTPSPIGQRAKNDPRGQHPAFVALTAQKESEPSTDLLAQSSDTDALLPDVVTSDMTSAADTVADTVSATDTTAAAETPPSDTLSQTQDTAIKEEKDALAVALPDVSPAPITAVAEVTPSAENAQADNAQDVPEVFAEPAQPVEASDAQGEQTDDKTPNVDSVVAEEPSGSAKDDDSKKKSASSYKDMIESVSGQLLQPMGILNLVATPKKPKAPKAKTISKSPMRKTSKAAQKAQVVKRKSSDTDDSGDTSA